MTVSARRQLDALLRNDIVSFIQKVFSELNPGEIVVVDVADPGSEHPFTFTGHKRDAAPDAPPVEFDGIVEGFEEPGEAASNG